MRKQETLDSPALMYYSHDDGPAAVADCLENYIILSAVYRQKIIIYYRN